MRNRVREPKRDRRIEEGKETERERGCACVRENERKEGQYQCIKRFKGTSEKQNFKKGEEEKALQTSIYDFDYYVILIFNGRETNLIMHCGCIIVVSRFNTCVIASLDLKSLSIWSRITFFLFSVTNIEWKKTRMNESRKKIIYLISTM